MKKILLILAMVLMFPISSFAVTAYWTQDMLNSDGTAMTDLAGWWLYETTTGTRVKVNSTLITTATGACTGSTTISCYWVLPTGIAVNNDTFIITAVDTGNNESVASNTAIFSTLAPKAPANLLIY